MKNSAETLGSKTKLKRTMKYKKSQGIWALINAFLLGFLVFFYLKEGRLSLFVSSVAFVTFLSITLQTYFSYVSNYRSK